MLCLSLNRGFNRLFLPHEFIAVRVHPSFQNELNVSSLKWEPFMHPHHLEALKQFLPFKFWQNDNSLINTNVFISWKRGSNSTTTPSSTFEFMKSIDVGRICLLVHISRGGSFGGGWLKMWRTLFCLCMEKVIQFRQSMTGIGWLSIQYPEVSLISCFCEENE